MSSSHRSQKLSPGARILAGLAVALGAIAVVTGVAAATDDATENGHVTVLPPARAAAAESATTTTWAMNAGGQSFGTELDAKSWSDRPDLISAVADNGEVGYVFAKDVDQPPTNSLKLREARLKAYLRGQKIPVYKSDGVTQIGVITKGGPGCSITRDGPGGATVTMTADANGTITTTTRNSDGTVTTTLEALDGSVTETTE